MSKVGNLSKLMSTYRAYRSRTEVCHYPPTRVWVEATSDCNLRCSFCCNRQLAGDQRGLMDFGLFQKIVDECAGGVRQFNLFHRGESLLHPRIGDMVRYAGARGLRTRINTNGTLLKADLARELVEARLDILSISFDGYDREMYEANRPGAGYDRVFGNILQLLSTKKEMNAQRPFVAIELMEISEDPREVLMQKRRDFLKQFDGLPLDKFIIRRPHNWGGLVDINSSDEPSGSKRIPCPLLWHALVVFWDGRVLPCPQDFFGALQLGDARKQDLMDIWNGERIKSLRQEMAQPKSLKRHPCLECDRIRRATVLGVPVDYLGRFLSETVFGEGWLSRILPH